MDDFFRALAKIDALEQMPDDWPNNKKGDATMGKQFKEVAESQRPVYSTIMGSAQEGLYAQEVPDAQEVHAAQEALRTQGKRGVKAQRINMAFTPSNLDYMRVMAGLKGVSMTQFVNDIIAREREQNSEAYEAAKKLTESL